MVSTGRLGLGRSWSLKRARLIRPLFDRSRQDVFSVSVGCVRILYRLVASTAGTTPFQTVFVVSKRAGSAPRRNQIRRILREATRARRRDLEAAVISTGCHATMAIVFRGTGVHDRTRMRSDLTASVSVLIDRLNEDADTNSRQDLTGGP